MWIAALIVVPLLALLELRAEHRALRLQIYLLKPLTTACVLLIAVLAPAPVTSTYQAAVMAGLLCSLAGDVFLMLPRNYFIQGLVSFLAAHVCYIIAFVSLSGLPRSALAAVLLAGYGCYLLARLWRRLGKYRGPVVIYTGVLLFMVAAAYQQLGHAAGVRAGLALAGAILFAASDSVLALDRFELGEKRRQLIVLATYFAAQWLIAASVSQAWAGEPPALAAAAAPRSPAPAAAAVPRSPGLAAAAGPRSPALAAAAVPRSPAPEVEAVCDSVAARWAGIPGAILERGDTLLTSDDILPDMIGDSFLPPDATARRLACHVAGTLPNGLDPGAPERLYWPAAGWGDVFRRTADGPDGAVRTFQREWVRCQVSEEWDGGDDTDSTYVPDPFYRERTMCWRHPRLVIPADTALPRW